MMNNTASISQRNEIISRILQEKLTRTYIPPSLYRIQFGENMNFKYAAELVPYFHDLGIHALYASPYFKTPPGSPHGYNIIDPNELNPQLGTRADYDFFCDRLRENGMEHIVDVVPNHMGIQGDNKLWQDVLENGRASTFSGFFDVNWRPEKKELWGKVLIPILGDRYGKVLENSEIQLHYEDGSFGIRYWEHRLPVDPKTYAMILEWGIEDLKKSLGEDHEDFLELLSIITAFRNLPERSEEDPSRIQERNREKEIAKTRLASVCRQSEKIGGFVTGCVAVFNGQKGVPESFDPLNDLLDAQAYRVAYWRVASEEINYRRFFDINELAAIRIENDEVFEYHHRLVFELIREGKIAGLRIDHPDGLYDPPAYFSKLQERYLRDCLVAALQQEGRWSEDTAPVWSAAIDAALAHPDVRSAKPLYVVAEKILDREESLPGAWNIHGTVGYEYVNSLNGIFIDQGNEHAFTELYEKYIGHGIDFDQLLYDKKKYFALIHMASEVNNLADRLKTAAEGNRLYRDFTRSNLIVGIREIMACFPVYRTYISPSDDRVNARDERYIRIAVSRAKAMTPALPRDVYDFLEDALLMRLEYGREEGEKKDYQEFVLRFQQLTGSVMAKGMEDTAFYIHNRLLSLNEVGSDPTHFGQTVPDFHVQNSLQNDSWPCSLLAASTHDSKRSEDVRMRLNVLSEIPQQWEDRIVRWSRMNEKYRTLRNQVFEPKRNTEYFIYQNLLGVWPDEEMDERAYEHFTGRFRGYLEKALREAKLYTNWINPNEAYEKAVKDFLSGILDRREENLFLEDFLEFRKTVSYYGKLNSLAALNLRLGCPGVVDVYQGDELWNYSLVDPDNRRPVDFAGRISRLHDKVLKGPEILRDREALEQGLIKFYLLRQGLKLRNAFPSVFVGGDYLPLHVTGPAERHVIAFMRVHQGNSVICASGRFFTSLYPEGVRNPGSAPWEGTCIYLPKTETLPRTWKDIYTGKRFETETDLDKAVLRLPVLFETLDSVMLAPDES